jgi:hypothetical protein
LHGKLINLGISLFIPRLVTDEEEQKLHMKQKSSTNGDEEEGEGKATSRSSSELADEEVEGDMEELHHPTSVVKTPPFQFGNYTRYLVGFWHMPWHITRVFLPSDNVPDHALPLSGHVQCAGAKFHRDLHVQIERGG